jgi:hypothetical protein
MGCYADVFVKNCSILIYKNVLPDFLTNIFNDCDRQHEFGQKASEIAKQHGLNDLANWLKEDENSEMIIFAQKASIIKKRLSIYGYSEDYYKTQIAKALDEEDEWLKELIRDNKKDAKYVELLQKELDDLCRFRKNGDENIDLISRMKQIDHTKGDQLIDSIPEDIIFYGCIRTLEDEDYVILDYSDLNGGGYMEISEFNNRSNNPVIVVEGPNDYNILSQSLKIIYPELVDNITFLDIDSYKVESNAGAVVKMIKSFAGAGIKNRILAVLDNDTGAQSALRAIKNKPIKLPNNLGIAQYPNIKICEKYPTIGPQGESLMDINGLAGSIEMYLGKEILTRDDELEKVMWTSYMSDVQKYQGELINKKEVNKRFNEIVKKIINEKYVYDFTDLKILWDHIIQKLGSINPI